MVVKVVVAFECGRTVVQDALVPSDRMRSQSAGDPQKGGGRPPQRHPGIVQVGSPVMQIIRVSAVRWQHGGLIGVGCAGIVRGGARCILPPIPARDGVTGMIRRNNGRELDRVSDVQEEFRQPWDQVPPQHHSPNGDGRCCSTVGGGVWTQQVAVGIIPKVAIANPRTTKVDGRHRRAQGEVKRRHGVGGGGCRRCGRC